MTSASATISTPDAFSSEQRAHVARTLQDWLTDLIAVGLNLKQAHWNVRGAGFKSVHEQLDEILADLRVAVDDVAERIVTIGGAVDGRPATVAETTGLADYPHGRLTVNDAVHATSVQLEMAIQRGRAALGDLQQDPVSEDLAIGTIGTLEKHHWLLRSQSA